MRHAGFSYELLEPVGSSGDHEIRGRHEWKRRESTARFGHASHHASSYSPRMKFVIALALFFSMASCKPKAGATCKAPGDRACAGETTELVCQGGTWAAFSCANGCKKQGDGVYCDVGLANENDPCPKEDETRKTCSVDHKSRLTCTDGKYVARKCVG